MSDPVNSGASVAIKAVSRAILGLEEAGRLPTTQELQASVGVGAGTIQKAFGLLEDLGAVSTRARGHKGRFVEHRDLGQLWRFADLSAVRAVLTPPGAHEVYGLVRGLRDEFDRIGVPLEIVHVRGGEERIEFLRANEHAFAVISAGLAGSVSPDSGFELMRLGRGTYYADGSILRLTRPGVEVSDAATRLGIDPRSHDHRIISEAEFGPLDDRITVPVPFPQVPRALLEGRIDAGVWHEMLLVVSPELAGIAVTPLTEHGEASVEGLTHAVVVRRTDDACLAAVLSAISWSEVERVQRVVAGDISLENVDTWYR